MSVALKSLLAASLGMVLLGITANADAWRPDEFLTLNLGQAVLSPKPLGPPARFEQVPVEAKAEPAKTDAVAPAPAVKAARAVAKPHARSARKVARSHRNPLDAQASDTRIQVWPCRSGAICNWKR
ncbi:hypothetical protein BH11PSE4_BH11PSE4_04110 [soil metagenome]